MSGISKGAQLVSEGVLLVREELGTDAVTVEHIAPHQDGPYTIRLSPLEALSLGVRLIQQAGVASKRDA